MIRKEGGRRPLLVAGNHRQMLQGIKENLQHIHTKPPTTTDRSSSMQIKVDPPQPPNTMDKNSASGKGNRVNYTQQALDQIRQSLEGFQIPEMSPAAGLNHLTLLNGLDVEATPVNKHMLQQLKLMGCDEELASRALKITGNKSVDAAVDLIQKYSNHETKNGFNKMAAPGLSGFGGTKVIRKPSFEEKYRQGSPVNSENSSVRSDSPGVVMPMNGRQTPPPPLPPRGVPPSSHGRNQTPPPPPPPSHVTGQLPPHGAVASGLLRRMSPIAPRDGHWPSSTLPQQHGMSPVLATKQTFMMHSPTGRHHAQAILEMNPQPSQGRGMPPPPPPLDSSAASHRAGTVGYNQPPPYSLPHTQVLPNKPIPSLAYSANEQLPPALPARDNSSPLSSHSPSPAPLPPGVMLEQADRHGSSKASPQPAPMQAWNAKQPPIIMQQVSSRQVMKPVLQTATAPLSPPPGALQPSDQQSNYVSSVEANVNFPSPSQSPVAYHQADFYAPHTQHSGQMHIHNHASNVVVSMEKGQTDMHNAELGYQQAISRFTCDMPRPRSHSPVPRSNSPMSDFSTTSTPSTNSDIPDKPPPPYPGKFVHSFLKMEDFANIPEEYLLDDDSHSEHSSSTMSEEPAESRLGAAKRRLKVQNYSPQAYKFFMEQHIENIFKSHQQRANRRRQLETEMQKVGLSEEAQNQMRKMLNQKESNYMRLKRAKMNKTMFEKKETLGIGAFGEVTLVRKLDTNQLYAMKTLRKRDVLQRNQEAHVKAERDILAEADNEWVVKLYYSFQDKDNLYFVMDYIPGGDLMSLLMKFGIFEESLAQFYVAELVLAIESVHNMGFIHRDIKPDNILVDRDGHIKLTDFGLCTGFRWTHNSKYYQKGNHSRQDSMEVDESWSEQHCQCAPKEILKPLERRKLTHQRRCLAHSLVGTPNYIAPEVLMRSGYTMCCDWWSVGVILYEMLVGQPPFLASTPAETQYKVIHWEQTLNIPVEAKLSEAAGNLILKLCRGAEDRLGSRGGGIEIKQDPFFHSIPWDSLRRTTPPYVPTILSATDTSNFDPVDPDKLRNGDSNEHMDKKVGMTSPAGTVNGKAPQHAFFEFTFRRFFDEGGQLIKPTQAEYFDLDSNSEHLSKSDTDYYGDTSSEHSVNNKESNAPVYV